MAVAARLIPADSLGPSAAEAGVVDYIERALIGWHAATLETYKEGIEALDAMARERCGNAFAGLTASAQDELLQAFEQSTRPAERAFFELVRDHVIEGMFADPHWGGNIGEAGWRLLGYPGPRQAWSEESQQLDVESVNR